MNNDEDSFFNNSKPVWNLYQFGLGVLCFVSVSVLFKIPIDYYFGSGWTLIANIVFIFIFASPFIYLQLRFGSTYKTGMLGIMDKFLPVGLAFTLGCYLRNFIHVIYTSALITHCLTYIFFSLFNCDGKLCTGGVFPWSSCLDQWAGGDCVDVERMVATNPTAEEKFYENFILMQTTQIATIENFPDWFLYPGLIIVPHLLTWLLLFSIIIGGAKIFGKLLYGLIPVAVVSYLGIFFYVIFIYANNVGLRSEFFHYFFSRFPTTETLTSWNQVQFQPLIWGFVSTSFHLSIGMNLWNGVYPTMGKWIGDGKRQTHLSWVIVVLVFGTFVTIPTLLNISFLASSFSKPHLRCQVARSWSFPFIIAPHVFTKFSSNKAVPAVYFLANLCFLLSSEGFLLLATLETIIDHMKQWNDNIAKNIQKSYKIACFIVSLTMCALSFSTIIKSGYYWIYLMDFYIDRLLCITMLGQAICLIVIYGFLKPAKLENKITKIFFIIYLSIISILVGGSLVWYVVYSGYWSPTKDCRYERQDPNTDPIPPNYIGLGWFVASSPILIGAIIAPILIVVHSRKKGIGKQCFYYMFRGDKALGHDTINYEEDEVLVEMNKRDFKNIGNFNKMPFVEDSIQYSSTVTNSQPESSFYINVGANNEMPNIMYDERQALCRPLITPQASSVDSEEYAKIQKPKKDTRPFQEESYI